MKAISLIPKMIDSNSSLIKRDKLAKESIPLVLEVLL